MIGMMNDEQRDALCEIFNIGIGRAAGALNGMVGYKVQLSVPAIEIVPEPELKKRVFEKYGEKVSLITMGFSGDVSGDASLLFPPDSATILVNALTGNTMLDSEMDALRMGTLTEVGNIIINGVIGSISNTLNTSFSFSLPSYFEGSGTELVNFGEYEGAVVLVANTILRVDELDIQCVVILFFNMASFSELLRLLEQGA